MDRAIGERRLWNRIYPKPSETRKYEAAAWTESQAREILLQVWEKPRLCKSLLDMVNCVFVWSVSHSIYYVLKSGLAIWFSDSILASDCHPIWERIKLIVLIKNEASSIKSGLQCRCCCQVLISYWKRSGPELPQWLSRVSLAAWPGWGGVSDTTVLGLAGQEQVLGSVHFILTWETEFSVLRTALHFRVETRYETS